MSMGQTSDAFDWGLDLPGAVAASEQDAVLSQAVTALLSTLDRDSSWIMQPLASAARQTGDETIVPRPVQSSSLVLPDRTEFHPIELAALLSGDGLPPFMIAPWELIVGPSAPALEPGDAPIAVNGDFTAPQSVASLAAPELALPLAAAPDMAAHSETVPVTWREFRCGTPDQPYRPAKG
jgi:hypothetical protein